MCGAAERALPTGGRGRVAWDVEPVARPLLAVLGRLPRLLAAGEPVAAAGAPVARVLMALARLAATGVCTPFSKVGGWYLNPLGCALAPFAFAMGM